MSKDTYLKLFKLKRSISFKDGNLQNQKIKQYNWGFSVYKITQ